jgi:hypothetical protein
MQQINDALGDVLAAGIDRGLDPHLLGAGELELSDTSTAMVLHWRRAGKIGLSVLVQQRLTTALPISSSNALFLNRSDSLLLQRSAIGQGCQGGR